MIIKQAVRCILGLIEHGIEMEVNEYAYVHK